MARKIMYTLTFLIAAAALTSASVQLQTPQQIALSSGLVLPQRPPHGWGPSGPPSGWSVPTTTTTPPPPTTTTPGWVTTHGWTVESTTLPTIETTENIGWTTEATTLAPVEITTPGWSVETTTTVGWAPGKLTGWQPPETTTTPPGWTTVPETTTGWNVETTTTQPETTVTPGWQPAETTESGWQAVETTTQGWLPPPPTPPSPTSGWVAPPVPSGWIPPIPSGWDAHSAGIEMEGEAAVVGGGAAGASHSSNTIAVGDTSNPATLAVNTGSYATLGQSAGVTQVSSIDPVTGESSSVQLIEGSNIADAGEYYTGHISGAQVLVQNEGNSFAEGQGAIGLSGWSENNSTRTA